MNKTEQIFNSDFIISFATFIEEQAIKDSIDLTMSRMNSQSIVLSGYEMEETGTNIDFNLEEIEEKIAKAISLKQQEIEKLKEYKTVLIDNVVTGKVKVS